MYSAVQDNGDNGHMSPNSRLLPSPVSSCTKATQRTHLATFKWLHRRSKLGPLKRARLSTAEKFKFSKGNGKGRVGTVWTEGIVCQIARSRSDFHSICRKLVLSRWSQPRAFQALLCPERRGFFRPSVRRELRGAPSDQDRSSDTAMTLKRSEERLSTLNPTTPMENAFVWQPNGS